MEMTIDEAITWLNTDDYESKGFAEATSVAIDIMRKYQKIAVICGAYKLGMKSIYCMDEIKEVIEDGSN